MKLIAQSDDYGITPGCAAGALAAIRHGIIRNTGLFANMPWAKECVDEISPFLDQIAFGIDLNASTGPSLLGHEALPALTKEDGMFYGSRENRAMDNDENGHDHLASVSEQLEDDMTGYLVSDAGGMLSSGKEYGYLVCHCGYADARIFALSSFNLCRTKDLEAVTSDAVEQWVKDHGIELITFRDLPRDWEEK